MSSNNNRTQIVPENSLNRGNNINGLNIRIKNRTIRDYFEEEDNVNNKGYIDSIKIEGNIRILALNLNGYRPTDKVKMHQLKQSIQKYNIDVLMLIKVNTKWDITNISRIEREMRQINRGNKIIVADSKEQNVISSDYLPGGIMNVISNTCRPIL